MRTAKYLDSTANGGLTQLGRSYGVTAWSPHLLLRTEVRQTEAHLTLQKLYTGEAATVWSTTSAALPADGEVVFINAGQLSYFDMGRGESIAIPVSYLGTVSAVGLLSRLRDLWTRLSGAPVPAGWYADPTGRHVHRYWNGSLWTDYVSPGGGVTLTDPIMQVEGH